MSIISEYYRDFCGYSPTMDFSDTIVDLCCYIIHSLNKRDEKDKAAPKYGFTPVGMAMEDLPGYELGFRALPMVYRVKRARTAKRGAMIDFYDVFKGTSQRVPSMGHFDCVPIPEDMFPFGMPVADVTWSCSNGMFLSLAYNLELGEVYYVKGIGLSYRGKGIRLYTCREDQYILAFNWITGSSYEIPIPDECLIAAMPHETWVARRAGTVKEHRTLCQIKSKDASKWALSTPIYNWLEQIYDLPTDYLTTIAKAYGEYVVESRGYAGTAEYQIPIYNLYYGLAALLVYFGNLFQSILQSLTTCRWFLPLLLSSINMGSPMPQKYNSIRQWLGITKPIYKKLFGEEDEKMFVFFMCMRMYDQSVSYEVFERVYKKVESLDKELSENARTDPDFRYAWHKPVVIRGPRGRKLFQTQKLPETMAFYTAHRLHNSISLNHFYKWLLDECYTMVKSGRYDRDTYICGRVQRTTRDFNRMAREIMPNASFTLPHNVDAAHDAMLVNFNKIKSDAGDNIRDTVALAACYQYRGAMNSSGLKYTMSIPLCASDLYEEGIQLNHCVGSYAKDIIAARGSMLIMFMRYVKSPSKSLVTVQLNRATGGQYYVSEAAGAGNRPLNKYEQEFLDTWLPIFNDQVSSLYGKKKSEISMLPYLQKWLKWATGKEMSKSVIADILPLDAEHAALHVAHSYFTDLKERAEKYAEQGGALLEGDYINIRLAALYGYCVSSSPRSVNDFITLAKV